MAFLNRRKILLATLFFVFLISIFQNGIAQTVVSGDVYGTWPAGATYWVARDITVPDDSSLTIEPGVEVIFAGTYSLIVNGRIIANGTPEKMISFRGHGGSWKNINFSSKAKTGCGLNYCIIKDAGWDSLGCVYIVNNDSNVAITNCEIYNSASHGIYIKSYLTTRGGDNLTKCCSATIMNNVIRDNAGNGVYVHAYYEDTSNSADNNACITSPLIWRNLIYQNDLNGIYCHIYANGGSGGWYPGDGNPKIQVNPQIQQNTIDGNGASGVSCTKIQEQSFDGTILIETNPLLTSNIISNNHDYGLEANSTVTPDNVKHNNFWNNTKSDLIEIEGRIGDNIRVNLNGDSCDVNLNIFFPPQFVADEKDDFYLMSVSKCINAGDLILPLDDDQSFPDIGAVSACNLKASFDADVKTGNPPLNVQFISTTTNALNPIISYLWSFGDNANSTDENPVHRYNSIGHFTVSLIVSDGVISDTTIKKNYITLLGEPQATTVSIDTMNASPADTLLVPINVIFPENASYNAAEIVINGYNGLLNFIEIITDSSLAGNAGWIFQINETDSLNIAWLAGAADISGEGVLFWLKFWVPDTAYGFIPISIESAVFDTGEDPVRLASGGVNILRVSTYGDVDLNGDVQAYDASLILKYLVGAVDLNLEQLLNANVSLDSSVSALDAAIILRYGVGLIQALPFDSSQSLFLASGNLTFGKDQELTGKKFAIPLILDNSSNISSFEGSIRFNPQYLDCSNVQWSGLTKDFTIEIKQKRGEILFAGASLSPCSKTGVLAMLHFTIKDNFNGDETRVVLQKLRWNENKVKEEVTEIALSVHTVVHKNPSKIPPEFALIQNYPNPFNPETNLKYQLPIGVHVELTICNSLGQRIRSLVSNHQKSGFYCISWDGKNEVGTQVPSGVYLYRLKAGSFVQTKKMLLLR